MVLIKLVQRLNSIVIKEAWNLCAAYNDGTISIQSIYQ